MFGPSPCQHSEGRRNFYRHSFGIECFQLVSWVIFPFYCDLVSFPVLASIFSYSYPVLFQVIFLDWSFQVAGLFSCSYSILYLFILSGFIFSLSTVPVFFASPSRWPWGPAPVAPCFPVTFISHKCSSGFRFSKFSHDSKCSGLLTNLPGLFFSLFCHYHYFSLTLCS